MCKLQVCIQKQTKVQSTNLPPPIIITDTCAGHRFPDKVSTRCFYKSHTAFLTKWGPSGYAVIFNIMSTKGILSEFPWLILHKSFCIYSKPNLFQDKNPFSKVTFTNFSKCVSIRNAYSILDWFEFLEKTPWNCTQFKTKCELTKRHLRLSILLPWWWHQVLQTKQPRGH